MAHQLSDAPPVTLMGLNFLHYSPLRRYYYFRNTVAFCKKVYVPWIWKLRMLVGSCIRIPVILVIDSAKFDSFNMIVKGLLDGIRGRAGKYQVEN
jgi:rhamnosyltransferase